METPTNITEMTDAELDDLLGMKPEPKTLAEINAECAAAFRKRLAADPRHAARLYRAAR